MSKIKIKSIQRFLNIYFPYFILGGVFLIIPSVAAQSMLGEGWDKFLGNIPGFAPNNETGENLAIDFVLNLVRIVRNLVGAVALVIGVVYALRLVVSRGQEETITKQKSNFLWMIVGFMILIVSENVARLLNPELATSTVLIDFNAVRDQLRDIIDYIKWLLGSVVVLYMIIVAFRMIMAQGEEEEINKQKKNLTWGLLGMLVILLASNIVNAVYVLNAPDEAVSADPTSAITEIVSVIRLILVFLAPAAIIFTIYAGFLYLTALDNEEKTKKAKTMILSGIVSVIIIYGAYALINTFTSADLSLGAYIV